MHWDAIGAAGEVAGAIAVVATLFYLSRQISQNSAALGRSNDYARASSIHGTNSLFAQVFSELARDEQLASIYQRALAGESLSEVENVRFIGFLNAYFAWLEDLHTQALIELNFPGLEDKGADFLIESTAPYWQRLIQTEAGRHWFETDFCHLFSPEFRADIGRFASEQGRPPTA